MLNILEKKSSLFALGSDVRQHTHTHTHTHTYMNTQVANMRDCFVIPQKKKIVRSTPLPESPFSMRCNHTYIHTHALSLSHTHKHTHTRI
jgi:hypothetical protein